MESDDARRTATGDAQRTLIRVPRRALEATARKPEAIRLRSVSICGSLPNNERASARHPSSRPGNSHVSPTRRDMGRPWIHDPNQKNGLFVLVFIDALADAILLPVNPVLFRLGKMAVVPCHIFLLALLHAGFALL